MKKKTFTKIWINRFFYLFSIWVSLSYILAFLGRDEIAESLSSNIVEFGIATVLIYCCKSYFETRSEEKIKLDREMMDLSNEEDGE